MCIIGIVVTCLVGLWVIIVVGALIVIALVGANDDDYWHPHPPHHAPPRGSEP